MPPDVHVAKARAESALEAGQDLGHVDAQFELHAHVLAFLPRQGAAGLDAHVLRLQDAPDPRQRRAAGIGPIARFAEGCPEESFCVHSTSWSRSDERRVGTACVSTCRSRWSPYP